MSIQHLGTILKAINPNAGLNPEGTCMHCAVIVANILTNGQQPTVANGHIASISGNGHPVTQSFPTHQHLRENALYSWLKLAGAGVYAVDAEDHAYNFLKVNAEIYLLDSNQHVFRKIRHLFDFIATGHNSTVSERYKYNYANPEPADDGSDINIYYWGALHQRWASVLAQDNPSVSYSVSGSATWE